MKEQEVAFTIMYNRYQPLMLKFAIKKFKCTQEAEDIVQEIFTSLWQRRELLSNEFPIKNYLLRAVQLQYAQRCRHSTVVKKYIQYKLGKLSEKSQSSKIENKELEIQIRSAINKISAPACRKIFELAFLEEQNCSEIAVKLNIKTQVVRNQTSRALKIVREKLKQVV
ncbi:sigma-70 family RNA polymerase sigma factor [Chitinophaga sancti]|uniref:sigma-70 family RNA polymerase sigma factor n=1 Tax=Chitinophaga sancti TaxID=1004 RepID=UPI002A763DC6|nr:sigma-70 family RNA polymerase sigma factor [Chitinophaga sancti]WPQ63366.1 sigma-70 family RNA polymerase sigma factor [Chitinophaga sancti]